MALSLEGLLKIKDREEFIEHARILSDAAIKERNIYLVYRLAQELDDRGFGVSKLEKYIASSKKPYFMLRFARDIKKSNIKRLQAAIIKSGNIIEIAKFGCFIRKADKDLIEELVIKSHNPKAAYLFLKFYKYASLPKLKAIIIKSKKPRYLFLLALKLTEQKDINQIQDLIIESHSNTYVRLFGKYVRGANIMKLENRIIQTGDIEEMKKFMKSVVGCKRIEKLLLLV